MNFNEKSMAGVGVAITLLTLASKYFGLDIDEGAITEGITAIAQGIGFVLIVIGQVRRKDLKFGMVRRKNGVDMYEEVVR